MKSIWKFLIAFLLGVVSMIALNSLLITNRKESFKYVRLSRDYGIENTGYLKRGTILKVDAGMSEGFTRYVLYLNLKGGDTEIYRPDRPDEIIPYWLNSLDSIR